MIVDSHHHVWRVEDNPWLQGPMVPRIFGPYEPIRRDYLADEFIADATGAGVSRSVYVQTNWPLERALDEVCDPMYARDTRALIRDTISPDIIHAGVKYNVIPGIAEVTIDCRVLPETSESAMRAEIVRRLGDDLAPISDVSLLIYGAPAESPTDHPLYELLEASIRDHDPDGVPLPGMPPFATDAKHMARLGVPTYGFSPLRLEPGERFLERFHGIDERVGVNALRWGLPVLYDVMRRFCG